MIEDARYVHTNLVAHDWRSLADFYERLFGCQVVPPVRDYSGPELERGTGVEGSSLKGVHLRLPGFGEHGPTLEVFEYSRLEPGSETAVNRPGFGHIAFTVASVPAARREVLAAGGDPVGEIVTLALGDDREVTWCYVTDPEGNVIELQSWGTVPGFSGADDRKGGREKE